MGKRIVVATTEDIAQPGIGRLILGFVMAPLTATLALVLLSRLFSPSDPISLSLVLPSFLIALAVATTSTVVFGLPVYLLLRRRVRPTLPWIALTGGLLGLATTLIFPGPRLWIGMYESWDQLPPGTLIEELRFFGLIMASGLIGGVAFWLCTVWHDPNSSNPVSS
jgi:hypothetical protein